MAKRDKDTITLGSGKLYMWEDDNEYADIPSIIAKLTEEVRLGNIKGGAAMEYTEETTEEKDDLGLVSKVVTTSEEALLKCGLVTWNGGTLSQLVDRCQVTEDKAAGLRITRIGGAGNAKGKYYTIVFKHEDKTDGNVYLIIRGRNTAGATLTYATDAGTVVEPEFKALPNDEDGTLVIYVEELPKAAEPAQVSDPEQAEG